MASNLRAMSMDKWATSKSTRTTFNKSLGQTASFCL